MKHAIVYTLKTVTDNTCFDMCTKITQRNKLEKAPLKVKRKFYKTVMRPAMMYGSNAEQKQK